MFGNLIERLTVQIAADVGDLKRGLNEATREVARTTQGMSQRFAEAGKGLRQFGGSMTTFVSLPLAAAGAAAIKTASDLEEMRSAFRFVFGDAAAATEAWAETTGDAIGRSTGALQGAALQFGQLFKSATPNIDQAADLSKQFAQLSVDLGSFFNVSDDDALLKLRSGLAGESEPLRAFGVFLTEASVAAKALELGLAGSAKEITEQDKILARAALIMEQTRDAQGDAARTADSFANSSKALQAELSELSGEIGALLLPIAKELVAIVKGALQAFRGLSPQVQTGILVFAGLAAVVGPLVVVIGLVVGAIAAIGAPVAIAIAAVTALIAIFVAFRTEIGAAFTVVGTTLSDFTAGALARFQAAWNALWGGLIEQFRLIGQLFGQIISGDWSGALETFALLVQNAVRTVLQIFGALAPEAVRFVADMVAGIRQWLVDRLGAIVQAVREKVEAVGKFFKDLFMAVVGGSYVPDMIDGIEAEFGRLDQVMVKPAQDAAAQVDAAFAGIDAPNLGGGLLGGPEAEDDVTRFGGRVQDAISGGLERALQDVLNGGKITDALKGLGVSLLEGILGANVGGGSREGGIGKALLGGFLSGLGKGVSNVLGGGGGGSGAGGGLLGGLFGGARAAGGPVSPGKSFLVGERGPELFSPRRAGRIIPNDALGGPPRARGGAGVVLNFAPVLNAQGADPAQVELLRREMQAMSAQIETRAIGAVREAQRRRLL